MRRIVTGVNEAGRSHVVSVEELQSSGMQVLWDLDPSSVAGWLAAIDPEGAAYTIEPQHAASRCMLAFFPPASDGAASPPPPEPGIDERGFHTTRTVDYDVVLQGSLTLDLDEGSVELEAGDVIVQQACRHAWRNEGDSTAVLLAVLTAVPGASA